MTELTTQLWFQNLVDELKDIIVESEFSTRKSMANR